MADILIPNMKRPRKGMYEEFRVWDNGRVDIYDCESECYIPTTKAIELPLHGRLVSLNDVIELLGSGISLDTPADRDWAIELAERLPVIVEATT